MAKAKGKAAKGKGKDGSAKDKAKARSPIRPWKFGVITAVVVAGYPLYQLVATGDLSTEGALLRIAGVSVVAMLGFRYLRSLVIDYQTDALVRKRANMIKAMELAEVVEADMKLRAAERAIEETRAAVEARRNR